MRTANAEVIVVGAGPAGAATAALLAGAGRDVLVLDKSGFPREKACAEYLSPGVADVLERLDALALVRDRPHARPRGIEIRRGRESFLVSYEKPRRALAIARPLLDAALLERARAAGARVRERTRVVGAVRENGRVVGVHARSDGHDELLRARVVVGADGLRSAIVRSLALERPLRWPRRLGLVARYRVESPLGSCAEMHVGERAYCGLGPIGAGLVTVGLVVPLGSKRAGEPTASFFDRHLAALPDVAAALRGAKRVTAIRGVAPLAKRVRRVAGPGYLLVGDAAGFLDPFTGEGVYRALRGAELAREAVERALSRRDGVPAGYEQARAAAFADKEHVTLAIQASLSSARVFEYGLRRLRQRPAAARVLGGALGDYGAAGPVLTAPYLFSLLRP